MNRFFYLLALLTPLIASGQVVTTHPTFPRADGEVIITVDVTGTSLDGLAWNHTTNPVYIWAWIENGSSDTDAPTNVDPATSPAQDAAKCYRISTNPDLYQVTITPTTFFNKPAAEIPQMGLKLKTKSWSDGKQTDNDRFITFYEGFEITFTEPAGERIFKDPGESFDIQVSASEDAGMVIKINDVEAAATTVPADVLNYTHTVSEPPGSIVTVEAEADNGSQVQTVSFTYIVRTPPTEETRPAGIIDGINYDPGDATKATLSLHAPGKSSVYVPGDFNNWTIDPAYQMKKDGEHFWLEITGLAAGEEYAYQYLVDEALYMADPYADKILDPDDQYIPEASYPGLKPYPQEALHSQWYFNRAAVLQTGQEAYSWQAADFEKPAKEKLVIYELLIRDFFGEDGRTWQNLTDTISYLKRLGVNAIELMPVMEFNGNESWGYNPAFMFAPDKYYGPKNSMKAFIDRCHQQGIAVILDIAMNHHDMPNPYVMMDFDFTAFKPAGDNKWFNTDAKHPFNVFFDMNHESAYTQAYLDTVNHYWLHEYKVDGFRFDLSKGFTQTDNPGDVEAWSAYDAGRIALLKRMADRVWAHTPDAWVILEHFAANAEEKELAEYRAGEGMGMMVWGNLNHAYNQNTMGYAQDSDIGWIYHGARSWTVPHVVGYMESHDEERLVYKNLQYGNAAGAYNTKSLSTALDRVKAASLVFYTVPGPKMLWQFGELGYDQSINRCGDGSISTACRVSPKPVLWSYRDETDRETLFNHTADLIRLRDTYDVFTNGEATLADGSTLIKQVTLKNQPYTTSPASADEMNVQVAVNFELTTKSVSVAFPHAGTWYDYYAHGAPVQVSSTPMTVSMKAGEYKLYTDFPITNTVITGSEEEETEALTVFPNPAGHYLNIRTGGEQIHELTMYTLQGTDVTPVRVSGNQWDVEGLAAGLYLAEIRTWRRVYRLKVVKE